MDLFEQYEELPQNVLDVLSKYEDGDFTYESCEALKNDLEAIGYTCDYGLDAEPYELRELSEFDKWAVEKINKVFEYLLDDMNPLDRLRVKNEVTTTDEKIKYFIEQEEKFKNSFK